jgi:hypothetical protein
MDSTQKEHIKGCIKENQDRIDELIKDAEKIEDYRIEYFSKNPRVVELKRSLYSIKRELHDKFMYEKDKTTLPFRVEQKTYQCVMDDEFFAMELSFRLADVNTLRENNKKLQKFIE